MRGADGEVRNDGGHPHVLIGRIKLFTGFYNVRASNVSMELTFQASSSQHS